MPFGAVRPDPRRFYTLVDFTDHTGAVAYILPSCTIHNAAEEADREFHHLHPGTVPTMLPKSLFVRVEGVRGRMAEEYARQCHRSALPVRLTATTRRALL